MKNEVFRSDNFIPFKQEDIILVEDAEKDKNQELLALIERYKPEKSNFKIYIDLDNYFIVLFPVLDADSNRYYLNMDTDYNIGNMEIEMFMLYLESFMRRYGIRQSKHFPQFFTLPVVYTDDVLDFILMAVPKLIEVADIYYTNNFKRVMIKRDLKVNLICSMGGIEKYLDVGFTYDDQISPDEMAAILNLLKEKEDIRFYQLKKGGFIDLRAEKVVETLEFLSKFGITQKELEKKRIIIPKCEIPFAANLLDKVDKGKTVKLTGFDLKSIEKSIYNISDADLSVPKGLKAQIRPYQQVGFKWMKTLYCAGLGGILADDMGLGKTLQTIALILSVYKNNRNVKALIIVPTSLIDNWMSELNRFAPDLKCMDIVGGVDVRKQIFKKWDEYNVFISSYGLVVNDIENYSKRTFDIMVLDEAQKIKNHLSKTAQEIKKIKAETKFALTGTPIENNLSELWSIFNWLIPPLLKDFDSFNSKYIHTTENIEELKEKIRPFILRRMKKDVLKDLPEKIETTIKIELTDMQKKLYLTYREQALKLLEEENKIFNVLSKLIRLRQICCHPGMFLENYKESSGKLDTLMGMIEELRDEGRKVLVFSQFTKMLDIVKGELEKYNIQYEVLDGRIPQNKRSDIVDNFNQGMATVFLISLKAGATGLNLTSADTVIHCDPWWNPGIEEQASARAYRIGQKNNVQIIYLITKGTIEEKINDVKKQKNELIEKLIQPGEKLISKLSTDELKQLLQ